MNQTIPTHIDPYLAAEKRLAISGVMPTALFTRLAAIPARVTEDPLIHLEFKKDEGGVVVVRGRFSITVEFTCQRCMSLYQDSFHPEFTLGVVSNWDLSDRLPKMYEPVLAVNQQLTLSDLIEDEVLLALPIIPKHPLDQCNLSQPVIEEADSLFSEARDEAHPFRMLKTLKDK